MMPGNCHSLFRMTATTIIVNNVREVGRCETELRPDGPVVWCKRILTTGTSGTFLHEILRLRSSR